MRDIVEEVRNYTAGGRRGNPFVLREGPERDSSNSNRPSRIQQRGDDGRVEAAERPDEESETDDEHRVIGTELRLQRSPLFQSNNRLAVLISNHA